jgi:hypothetical protein
MKRIALSVAAVGVLVAAGLGLVGTASASGGYRVGVGEQNRQMFGSAAWQSLKLKRVRYHVEELPGDRGQLVAAVVVGGRRGRSSRFGSPAPPASVRKASVQLNRFRSPKGQARGGRRAITTDNIRRLTPADAVA